MILENFWMRMARHTWGGKKREAFYRRMAAMIENGMPILQAVKLLRDRSQNRFGAWSGDPDVLALSDIAAKIQNGATFTQAIANWAPKGDLALINAGEVSGKLHEVLRVTIDSGKVVKRLRAKIIAELFDPALFAGVGFYLIYVIGSQMVPAMEQALPLNRWPAAAKPLIPMGWFATSGLMIWLLAAFVLFWVVTLATMSRWAGGWRKYFDRVPPWSIYRVIQGAGWVVGFSNLLKAGVPVVQALRMQSEYAPPWLKRRLDDAAVHVVNGFEIGPALTQAGYGFPDTSLIEDIQAFSNFKDFPDLVRKLGQEWLEQSEEKIVASIKAFGAVFNISVNLVIVAVVLGMNALQTVISSQH